MKANIEVEIIPFKVPDSISIIRKSRFSESGTEISDGFILSDLSNNTLSDLCDEFRASVFEKAQMVDEQKYECADPCACIKLSRIKELIDKFKNCDISAIAVISAIDNILE